MGQLVLQRHVAAHAKDTGADRVVIRCPGFEDVTVTVVEAAGGVAKLAVEAPRAIEVDRYEVRRDKDARAAAQRDEARRLAHAARPGAELWRHVWREGFAPVLSTAGLTALRDALLRDDPRLTQGSTTTPPPLMCVQDWPVEAADAIGLTGWLGDGLATVGEVEEHFARCCWECDQRLGEPAGCRWFLNTFDNWPRDEMLRELLAEVELALTHRTPTDGSDAPTAPARADAPAA